MVFFEKLLVRKSNKKTKEFLLVLLGYLVKGLLEDESF